jgi:WD40 repeat protein
VAQDGTLTKLVEADAPGGKRPYSLAFHPDGSRIAVGYFDSRRVDVVDGRSLTPLFAANTEGVDNGSLSSVAWSRDGRSLVAAGSWASNRGRPARIWPEAGRGQPLDIPLTNTTAQLSALPAGGKRDRQPRKPQEASPNPTPQKKSPRSRRDAGDASDSSHGSNHGGPRQAPASPPSPMRQ